MTACRLSVVINLSALMDFVPNPGYCIILSLIWITSKRCSLEHTLLEGPLSLQASPSTPWAPLQLHYLPCLYLSLWAVSSEHKAEENQIKMSANCWDRPSSWATLRGETDDIIRVIFSDLKSSLLDCRRHSFIRDPLKRYWMTNCTSLVTACLPSKLCDGTCICCVSLPSMK